MRTEGDLLNLNGDASMKTLGFIVNPIAGMGGAVGLKGTDGKAILERALDLGAKPTAPSRAESFLTELRSIYRRKIGLIVGAGSMGEEEAENCGFDHTVLGERRRITTAEDTKDIAKKITSMGADLLVFSGGDGTARDILEAVHNRIPVLGVPTGVKMHSAVFATNPEAAARMTSEFLWEGLPIRESEVMDVDEEAFRMGRLSARLYGYVLTPYEPHLIQGVKTTSPVTESELRN